jgi:hypothetical protein
MYGLVYSNFLNYTKREQFSDMDSLSFMAILFILMLMILQLFIVQWLWNNVLTRVLPVRPLPSLLYTLGLLVLIALLFPGSM